MGHINQKRVTQWLCYPFFYAFFLTVSPAFAETAPTETESKEVTVEPFPAHIEIRQLINTRAYSLALQILEQEQSDVVVDAERWVSQEKLRIQLYQLQAQWPVLINRLKNIPDNLPEAFVHWVQTRLAEALIFNQQGDEAISVLRDAIWNIAGNSQAQATWMLTWRRMVIEAYWIAGYKQDAYLAASRLQRDYSSLELPDLIQYAKILLSIDRAEQAMDILHNKASEPEAGMLYLLAQLRSQSRSAKKIVQAGLRQLRGEGVTAEMKAHLWAVVAEAAQQSGDRSTMTNALEHVIAGQDAGIYQDELFAFTSDSLWNSYMDYAIEIGNQSQFLVGVDEQWMKAAEKVEAKLPVRARSLYALLIFKGQDTKSRDVAVKKFIRGMFKRKQGKTLLNNLFLSSSLFPDHRLIPEPARHAIADIALGESKIQLASTMMATIQKPPAGADQFNWYLRRARILIMGAKAEAGADALLEMLQSYPMLEKEQLDRVMQVIFDLQTVGLHSQAYMLFEQVQVKTDDSKLQREIYFWMAESLKADENYVKAARYFLKSAMLLEPDSMDPWAQTARYQAAESLAHAGLVEDAHKLYQQLLKATKDSGRRAVLLRDIQKLWLRTEPVNSPDNNTAH
ncbi:MAG: hypothetical protein OQK73_02950 [Gammaproteobacteria bacterium]|nr:hypothetical protein [Gammaproteobacteria bacterium]